MSGAASYPRSDLLTIGQVASRAEVGIDTIRYYEKEGLLAPVRKSPAGYRLYTPEAVRRLGFVRHAQQCGFSLAEIRELLELKTHDDACCNDVRSVVIQKKLQVEGKIKALRAMSQALSGLIDICDGGARPLDECPILDALESSVANEGQRNRSRKT
ncbi:MAG: heavy metal-responsive transcriptional regulator [Pseudomonadota bacterium]